MSRTSNNENRTERRSHQESNIEQRKSNVESKEIEILYNINDSVQSITISMLRMVAELDGALVLRDIL